MPDDLTLSGGGSIAVATDELFAAADSLAALADRLHYLRSELARVDRLVQRGRGQTMPHDADHAERDMDAAAATLALSEWEARALRAALMGAADGYGFSQLLVRGLFDALRGQLASVVGAALPTFVIAAGLGVAIAAPGALMAGASLGTAVGGVLRLGARPTPSPAGAGDTGGGGPGRLLNELLANPVTVDLVAQLAKGSGSAALAAAGVPIPLAAILGSTAIGSVALMRTGGVVGLTTETPVRLLESHAVDPGTAPTDFVERLARVPDTDETEGAQVRIDSYRGADGTASYAVYIAGTVTFSPVADTEPWDMTSNLANAVGAGGGSYSSVAEAMRLAGIDESSPVQFIGYSQGGATAAQLAASGNYNTQGLLTFGGPTGQIDLPREVPAVIVAHDDDLITALGGPQESPTALLVQREVFGPGEMPGDVALPPHHRENYAETARLMDAASSERLRDATARLNAVGQHGTLVSSTDYRFERVTETTSGRR